MRAWIEEIDDLHEAHIHAADKRDIDAIAKHCADLRAIGATGTKDDKHVMTADSFTIMAWCNKAGISWREFWNDNRIQTRFVEDADNAAFRVWTGRL